MAVHVELKRKITVNGRDYESLDEIPEEFQAAIQSALASSAVETKIEVNGTTYASAEELPESLRAVVRGVTSLVASPSGPVSVRPEPVVSMKTMAAALCLVAILALLARLVF